MRAAAMLVVAAVALAACTATHKEARPPVVSFRLPAPPAESTWPPYPSFDPHSCWARSTGAEAIPVAPSFAVRPTHRQPTAVVNDILRRLGDRRFVTRVELAPVSPVKLLRAKAWFAGRRPPPDAIWAWVGTRVHGRREAALASWEGQLVGGALRDELCAAGGSPLVGWSVPGRSAGGISDDAYPYGERFPNPPPAAFRRALRAAGAAYGFRPVEVRILRPLGLAPLVVVRTDRPRKEFYADVGAILELLNPRHATFEAAYFEARDAHGPFIRLASAERGTVEGSSWVWDPCLRDMRMFASRCK
jgi:hypothetical protein